MPDDLALELAFTTAAAPVQAEGTVGGRPFYFRARHDEWTFAVAEAPGADPVEIEGESAAGWFRAGAIPGRGAASRLSAEEATRLIRECAAAYLRDRAR